MNKEKIPLAMIYKQDGFINIDFTDDMGQGFEMYGYLKCLVEKMGKDLEESLEEK